MFYFGLIKLPRYLKMWNENNKNSFLQKMCKNSSLKLLNQSVDHFLIDKLNKQQLYTKTFLEFKGELGYGSWGVPLLVKS